MAKSNFDITIRIWGANVTLSKWTWESMLENDLQVESEAWHRVRSMLAKYE